LVILRSERVGGVIYRLPLPIDEKYQFSLVCHWIIVTSKSKDDYKINNRLFLSIKNAYYSCGPVNEKQIEIHTVAISNRPFMRY